VEYPDFTMDGTTTPDITQIRTRTPLPQGHSELYNHLDNTVFIFKRVLKGFYLKIPEKTCTLSKGISNCYISI